MPDLLLPRETIIWLTSSDHCFSFRVPFDPDNSYSLTVRNRNALPITLTEDSDIAAAAKTGDSKIPKNGYSNPAAIGIPAVL